LGVFIKSKESKMGKTGKRAPGTNDESTGYWEDTSRIKIIEEIKQLSNIPEIREYFFRALLEARHIFKYKIEAHRGLKNNPPGIEPEKIPGFSHALKSKPFFFELSRSKDLEAESGCSWKPDKCNLPPDEEAMKTVFNDFIKKIEEYEIAPHLLQDERVHFQPLNKWFLIRFTKSSPTRVVGFVKEVEEDQEKLKGGQKKEEEKKFVKKVNRSMLKIDPNVTISIKREELEEFLRSNHEFTDDMVFLLNMKRQSEFPD
jgi:hypothetical protein